VRRREPAARQVETIEIEILNRITDVPAPDWDRLIGDEDPFLEHAFLAALEASRSVGADAGCMPRFVLLRAGHELVGAVPLYLKTHSFGEYIFDWAWADAAERANITYYPKLVAAVPYTPSTGRRLLVAPGVDGASVAAKLLRGVRAVADREQVSSVHFLFCTDQDLAWLTDDRGTSYVPRLSLQFHWENRRDRPFASFEEFLSTFRSRNRKQVHKERVAAAAHGLRFRTATGRELGEDDWEALQRFYASNVARHGGIEYLRPAFFEILRETLAHRLVATLAYRGSTAVAGTVNFEKGRRLYGRYWGCSENFEMLHFELCYYQLIERAIEHGYTRFEAGAQGEHKLKRGLRPAFTHSAHFIRHPVLARAVGEYVRTEAAAVAERAALYAAHAPFRTGVES